MRFQRAARDFEYFLRYWRFLNRETGEVLPFIETAPDNPDVVVRDLWPGQRGFVEVMRRHKWIFALKAGKLGFTELECAYDAWVAISRPYARVHIFSVGLASSQNMLHYVRFGVERLPPEWGIRIRKDLPGGDMTTSFILSVPLGSRGDPADVRQVVSYPATGIASIDQSAFHTHVDELSHMVQGQGVWNSVSTTVAPGGSCHVVTRGAGDTPYSATLWRSAVSAPPALQGRGPAALFPYFAPHDARPPTEERNKELILETGGMTLAGVNYYLPATAEDALMGDDTSPFIPLERWDLLREELPILMPGDRTPVIISLDAAVTQDCFGLTIVSLHPDLHPHEHDTPQCRARDIAIRGVKLWEPENFTTGHIDYLEVERYVRFVCRGGCPAFHPRPVGDGGMSFIAPECSHCQDSVKTGRWHFPEGLNVVQLCYDPYQLEGMAQSLFRDGVVWTSSFDQGTDRLEGDALMKTLAYQGRLAHTGNEALREHVGNARAKQSPDEDTKLRIVKKSPDRHIDLAVAASMGIKRMSELLI